MVLSSELWHRFFFFLGTSEGTFFKRSLELIIFLLLSYMVISEFLRTSAPERKEELRLLIVAFLSLLVHRMLDVIIYANVVFGSFSLDAINIYWPILDRLFDLITLLLLLHAFIYPVFRTRLFKFTSDLHLQVIGTILISVIINIFWIRHYSVSHDFHDFWGNYIFVIMQFLIILYALYEMYFHSTSNFKYRGNIFLAFWLYLMVPVLHLINIIAFDNNSLRLRLLEQPFPILAILLLTEVTYLKLVDKAYLQQRLSLAERKYRLEKELGEMKDEFVSVVSHELRTPLTSIKLYLGLLLGDKFGTLNDKQQEAVKVAKTESDRLSSLIDDILNLSKLEAGKDDLRIANFNLSELRNDIYYVSAQNKGIKVEFDIPENFIVRVDPAKFTQVFLNLMSNATKFTKSSGKITVSVQDFKNEWSLTVADTGKGIPRSELPRLFDKFYQVESHMTRTIGGTGLGLAIVKKIVDLHKGRIEVESVLGKGSRFTVFISKDV